VVQVPSNHQLRWEVAEDGASVMLYIVLTDSPEESQEADSSVEGGERGPTSEEALLALGEDEHPLENAVPGSGVGDEFEDEIKVGMDD